MPILDWGALGHYKADGAFPDGYPDETRTFYSPYDDVHGLLVAIVGSARQSLVLNMYGYDDEDIDAEIRKALDSEQVYVQMSLDRSQAGGVHEREILAKWKADLFGNSIAVGTSRKHAISHLKLLIVDGIYLVSGSTNWSLSGEQKQDNQLTVQRSAVLAAEARSILDRNHDWMLEQMAQRRSPEH